jgi:hypothetical protein
MNREIYGEVYGLKDRWAYANTWHPAMLLSAMPDGEKVYVGLSQFIKSFDAKRNHEYVGGFNDPLDICEWHCRESRNTQVEEDVALLCRALVTWLGHSASQGNGLGLDSQIKYPVKWSAVDGTLIIKYQVVSFVYRHGNVGALQLFRVCTWYYLAEYLVYV